MNAPHPLGRYYIGPRGEIFEALRDAYGRRNREMDRLKCNMAGHKRHLRRLFNGEFGTVKMREIRHFERVIREYEMELAFIDIDATTGLPRVW